MGDVILDALIDTAKIFPFLIIAYILIELLTYRFGDKLNNAVLSKWAPFFGGLVGIVPQCGFSVVSTELYTRRFITIGTLFAVFLATSDEAFIIMLSSPEGLKAILPVILIKLISAIVFGTLIDLVFSKRNHRLMAQAEAELEKEEQQQQESGEANEQGNSMTTQVTCGCGCCAERTKFQMFFLDPLLHSLKIIAFIFVINLVFGSIMFFVGEENVIDFLQSSKVFAPVFASLVGLIPNCASSVIVTELYLLGGLDFASLVAGLCANVGVGSIILFKNLKLKESILIIISLFAISLLIGYLLMLFKVTF